jgi:hypothetical protein
VQVQAANEAALVKTVGFSDPQLPDTLFAKNNVRIAWMRGKARQEAEQMCSPEFQPKPWEEWRERINKWAGGIDTYKYIYDVARELPADTLPENVEPRRWWKGDA